MAWYNNIFKKSKSDQLTEELKQFRNKGEKPLTPAQQRKKGGEGIEDLQLVQGYGNVGLSSFNLFYRKYIDKVFENEIVRINEYRSMALLSEIADVIEDATNESTQEDDEGSTLQIKIKDPKLQENENIVNNIEEEFRKLFYENININDKIWDMFRSYYIDGRFFYERIIDSAHPKEGIIGIKKLPTESMDYFIDPISGDILKYFQYLSERPKRPGTLEEAEQSNDIIIFNPNQISFANYGVYGKNKYEILGYLEKAAIPYNQLKLLETSVIIYRIVRAPERFVFRIDTGAMPMDKAMKFVEKVKSKMVKKQSYDATTGKLSQEPEVLCIRKDTEIPLLDNRNLTLKEIVKEHEEGKENWVYTINQNTLNIEPGKIKNAKITRLNEKLIRTWLDNDEYIDTTYDHKYILRDGSECKAEDLKPGQSLMPLYRTIENISTSSKLKYEKIYNPGTEEWIWTHKISSGKTKRTEVCHHKDFNRFNNNPNNLQIIDKHDHMYLHTNVLKEKWENDYENQCESIRNGIKKWHSIEENKKRHSEWVTKTNIEQNKAAKMQKVLNTPEVRKKQIEAVRNSKTEWFANEGNKKAFKKKKTIRIDGFFVGNVLKTFYENNRPIRDTLINILNKNNKLRMYLKLLNKDRCPRSNFEINRNIIKKVMDKLGYNDYAEFRREHANIPTLNHKVEKIEYLSERDDTGCIEVEGNNHNFAVGKHDKSLVYLKNSILENFYLPQSSDGRGSQIETVGGNSDGFTSLDDIYYFARKLYRALKYPLSRVSAGQEKREADVLFGGNQVEEISRDEVKWARFLERQQKRVCDEMLDIFLLHLEFKGLKDQYGINKKNIELFLNSPSHYKKQTDQSFLSTEFDNYNSIADREEISKSFAMKRYLHWDDDTIKENVAGFKKDKELGLVSDESSGY